MSTLTRRQQRELAVLKTNCDNAMAAKVSTGSATIHCSADTVEWLKILGGDTFRDYTAAERRRMAQSGQALPDGSFPIANCADAANAIASIGRAKDRNAARTHIRKRVRALRCTGGPFDGWK